jgi:multiple sugar transport system permease protein
LVVFIPSLASPLGVYLARLSADTIPDELMESARLDGASEYRMFRSVALHLMRPALGTIFLFQLVAIWNNFALPLLMLTSDDLYPVTLGLFS